MKATLLFASTLSMLLASPGARGMTELEALRAKCSQQEQQIQNLEKQLGGSKPATAAPAKSATPSSPATTAVHVVKSGESLERIARRSGCSASQLAKANGMKTSSVIHPGQKLTIPGVSKPASPVVAEKAQVAAQPAPVVSKYSGKTHKVRQGETFFSISKKYRMSTNSLMAANPSIKATSLRPGLVLRLSKESAPAAAPAAPATVPASAPVMAAKTSYPEAKPAAAPKAPAPRPVSEFKPVSNTIPVIAETPKGVQRAASAPTPAPAPAVAEHKPVVETPAPAPAPQPVAKTEEPAPAASSLSSPNPEKKVRSVTVDNEMTYGEFASNHGTDTVRLNDLNGLDLTQATVLAKGSELYVPAQP